jgi:lysine biosynthesis protein LysW
MYHERRKAKGAVAECPSCGARVPVGRKLRIGQSVGCPVCRERLEVVWLNPVELDWPIDDQDDSYDDYDE